MNNSVNTISNTYPGHPRVAVGAVVFKEDRVLMVLRGKPPAESQWAIPGGCIELGETLQEAAEREIMEETGLTIQAGKPVYTFDVIERDETGRIRFHYIIVDLEAVYIHGDLRPGDDALDVSWVSSKDVQKRKVSDSTRKLLIQCYGFGK